MNSAAPLRPPFDLEKAVAKVRAAENAWNSRDAQRVSLAYSEDSCGAIEIDSFEGAMRLFNS